MKEMKIMAEERSEKRKYDKKRYKKNIKKILKRSKKYYAKNKTEILKLRKEYSEKNKKKISEYDKRYYKENKEIILERSKKWQRANSEKVKENSKKWRKANPEKAKCYIFEKRHTDSRFKLKDAVSKSIWSKLRFRLISKKRRSTWDFLPYTVEELIQHLENLFTEGMSWDNYGKWHIDHKIADCKFNYKSVDDEEFQECWALKNLQPLWAIDNLRKGNR